MDEIRQTWCGGVRLLVLVAMALCLAVGSGSALAAGGFKTGEDLVRQFNMGDEGRAEQSAYIVGVLDGENIVSTVAKFKSPICLPSGVPTQHLSLLVQEWLESHPDRQHQQAANLVLTAVKESFPCRP
ncbi:MAG: Rap1a/Tai family immunity protein [Candidatus Binatia bacterium]|nr:Rap1a/Tai family immunity protein [Candidatus Binatia bacterium]